VKLVVGLGNPGKEYDGTRHNVGFVVAERLAERSGCAFSLDKRLGARIAKTSLSGHDVVLIEPQSYMNLCGPVVAKVAREREVVPEDVLVISDDFHLPLGKLRVRREGSAGGHNGLRSLIGALGTDGFARLRVGIGEPREGYAEQYVLKRFRPAERKAIDEALDLATDCAEDWCSQGTGSTMNRYNG